jgi:hypothetical protein
LKNVLPRDEHVWLLVAESVRIERDGKVSLFGFFGTERIRLAVENPFPSAFPSLTFLFLLRDGVGSFNASFQIRDPNGNLLHREPLAVVAKQTLVENHGVTVRMEPFVVPSFGDFRLTLTLDGRRYKRILTVAPDIDPVPRFSLH